MHLQNFQVDRVGAVAAKFENKVYVMGGFNGNDDDSAHDSVVVLDCEDPSSNWSPTSPMPKARAFAACAVLNGTYAKHASFSFHPWTSSCCLLSLCTSIIRK